MWQIKEGKDKFHISVNGNEYKLKTIIKSKELHITTKPDSLRVENWDKKIQKYLDFTIQQKEELEQYRKKDLEHLRTNFFVSLDLAKIVESHLSKTEEEIGKYQVEINKIQDSYKRIENKKEVVD